MISTHICVLTSDCSDNLYSHLSTHTMSTHATFLTQCLLTSVCSHLSIHICVLTSVCSHLSVDTSTHICLLISVCAHLSTHICVFTSVYSHLSAHTASHTMSTHICVLTSVYTRLSAHKCLLTTSAHICLLTSVCSRMSTQSTLETRQISVTIPRSNEFTVVTYRRMSEGSLTGAEVIHRQWPHRKTTLAQVINQESCILATFCVVCKQLNRLRSLLSARLPTRVPFPVVTCRFHNFGKDLVDCALQPSEATEDFFTHWVLRVPPLLPWRGVLTLKGNC